MFNDKPYIQVNREERFYCAILLHLLLASRSFRERFFGAIDAKIQTELDADAFEVFCEIAILRDYWDDLGDSENYDQDTHERRKAIIEMLLPLARVHPSEIVQQPFFWTKGMGSKLWYPGHWREEAIDATEWADKSKGAMKKFKHAFNSKPDLMIISGHWAVLIETKVESRLSPHQWCNQKLVAKLMKKLIPRYVNTRILNMTLTARDGDLFWGDVVGMLDGLEIDGFSRQCMRQLLP